MVYLRTASIIALMLTLPVACSSGEPVTESKVEHVDAKQAAALLTTTPDVVVLDVRTADEYAAGHLAEAVNIDFYGADFATELGALDVTKNYLVHCKSGGRSTKALEQLKTLGFEHVWHLDGGFLAWTAADQAVAGGTKIYELR